MILSLSPAEQLRERQNFPLHSLSGKREIPPYFSIVHRDRPAIFTHCGWHESCDCLI